ncbi:hypothetical protein RRG08_007533 [Elysia crispata]|uniref:PiggyBac transposable element-derived protein 4 C-terminal zinc-ribbon domain-containing protein n=1 Tax=Elysia crispata TaxID=231223 RepID=A0AAE1CY56_9GAST|nr:hypothetical protein RRG08_007533 [Elysia crispata]
MWRKSQKWWRKPFFHLLTLVSIQTTIILNLHKKQHGRPATNLAAVVKDLIIALVDKDVSHDAEQDNLNLPLVRIRERHFIKLWPEKDGGGKSRRQCKVCIDRPKKTGMSAQERKSKRKVSKFWCPKCKVRLCLDCFEIYHTKVDYTE